MGHRFAYVPDGGTKIYDGMEDLIAALQTGILSRRVVRFAYKDSRGRARRGELAPFVMLLYRHGLYVVGSRVSEANDLKEWRRGLGVFAVERITEAEHLRQRSFEVPSDFKIEQVLHRAFGVHVGDPENARRVVIEFSREKADFVTARQWHPTQEVIRSESGHVTLSFICTNLLPVVSWVHQLGHHAWVIEPPELMAMVEDELRQSIQHYDHRLRVAHRSRW